MNVQQHHLIREFMLYELELSHNATKVAKSICCEKGEHEVDQDTFTICLKKFRLGCKNLDDQERSGRPKTAGLKAVSQTIDANQVSNTWRVSGELGI